jgi:hypothetical protein
MIINLQVQVKHKKKFLNITNIQIVLILNGQLYKETQ